MAAVRSTKTNEPRRCAGLLPVLAGIAGPLALLEVGASAGLCLYPDRYSYSYDGLPPLHPADGPSPVLLEAGHRRRADPRPRCPPSSGAPASTSGRCGR